MMKKVEKMKMFFPEMPLNDTHNNLLTQRQRNTRLEKQRENQNNKK